MIPKFLTTSLVASMSTLVLGQTFTDCNPLENNCSPNPALGSSKFADFTKGHDESVFKLLSGTTLEYDAQKGAVFSIKQESEAPTIASNMYIFFGKLEVVLQAAPSAGVVTSIVLQSDDLDEIDLEWVGGDPDNVQTNYFSKGNTTTYDRGRYHPVPATTSQFHTYTLEWTPEAITWSVDGGIIRTVTYAEAYDGLTYPQTPMQVKLGTWIAGKKDNPQGTIDWAGGMTDFGKAPFVAYYKSISITDYSNGVKGATQYRYGDRSGTYESIIIDTDGSKPDDDDDKPSTTTTKPTTTKPKSTASTTTETTKTTEAETTTTKTRSRTTLTSITSTAGTTTSSPGTPAETTSRHGTTTTPPVTVPTEGLDEPSAASRFGVAGLVLTGVCAIFAHLLV